MVAAQTLPRCRFFSLEEIADGVYAALAVEGVGTGANAGIVDLGGATIVFDTFRIPRAGAELRAVAETLTGRPVTYVINSHWHRDHTYGTQSFPGVPVIATPLTREIIQKQGQKRLEEGLRETEKAVQANAARLAETLDETERRRLATTLNDNREFLADLPLVRLVLPTLTFTDRICFHGSKRTAELITYGPAHSPSDGFLYLPGDAVALMGDILSVQTHPNMTHGDADRWLDTLEKVQALDLSCALPGHGPIGTKADIALLAQYIRDVKALVGQLYESGATPEQAATAPVPAAYSQWAEIRFFRKSISDLYAKVAVRP